jgi:hypothetical protein
LRRAPILFFFSLCGLDLAVVFIFTLPIHFHFYNDNTNNFHTQTNNNRTPTLTLVSSGTRSSWAPNTRHTTNERRMEIYPAVRLAPNQPTKGGRMYPQLRTSQNRPKTKKQGKLSFNRVARNAWLFWKIGLIKESFVHIGGLCLIVEPAFPTIYVSPIVVCNTRQRR